MEALIAFKAMNRFLSQYAASIDSVRASHTSQSLDHCSNPTPSSVSGIQKLLWVWPLSLPIHSHPPTNQYRKFYCAKSREIAFNLLI